MHAELFEKSHSIDLSCFDDPEFYNDFVWAMNECDKRATMVLDDMAGLISRVLASTSLFGLLFTIDPIVTVILFVSSAISIGCRLIGNKVGYNHGKESNPLWRKRSYINRVYHLSDYAKELRISKADELLMAEYDQLGASKVSNTGMYQMVYDKWMDQIDKTYKRIFTEEQWAAYLKSGAARAQKARDKRKAKGY